MRSSTRSALLVSRLLLAATVVGVGLAACSSESSSGTTDTTTPMSGTATATGSGTTPSPTGNPTGNPTTAPTTTTPAVDRPGPAPAGCSISKDGNGFFTRSTSKSDYVGYVPPTYAGQPSILVVGTHGCGDSAYNFATWAINPWDTRQAQIHIGISIGGQDGNCWDPANDMDKVTAAIADISTCFYVHQQKVVLAGYSSGGELAYKLGLTQASKFAGILIEDSGLAGVSPSVAAWKINVAHITHNQDQDYPLASVQADWATLLAAGIPLQTKSVDGPHDGTSTDWATWLLPRINSWKAP